MLLDTKAIKAPQSFVGENVFPGISPTRPHPMSLNEAFEILVRDRDEVPDRDNRGVLLSTILNSARADTSGNRHQEST
jgi:hypothetical protein